MQRHRFDPLSFTFGLLFVAVAGVALIGPDLLAFGDLAWVAPALLVVAGAALLLSSAGRSSRDDTPDAADVRTARTGASPDAATEAPRATDAPSMGAEPDGR